MSKAIVAVVAFISPVLWLTRLALLLVFAIPGVPVIYVLARRRVARVRFAAQFGRDLLLFPRAFCLYNNVEDGVDGLRGGDPAQQWWADRTAGWPDWRRIWIWSALRNPVDGLRLLPLINPKIDPARIRYVGSMDREPQDGEIAWYFAWQGLYSCIRWEFEFRGHFYRLWLGWKLKPEDRHGLQPGDARAIRCDFAAQAKRVL